MLENEKVYRFFDEDFQKECEFRCIQVADGEWVYMVEVFETDTGIPYIEFFLELDNALDFMESKGVFDMSFLPPEEELAFWENVCT